LSVPPRTERIVLLAILAVQCSLYFYEGFKPFDDTYIIFRYSENIAHGQGFVFNAGQHVLGTTTPLWTLILAVAALVRLPLPEVAYLSGALLSGASVVLIALTLRRLGFPGWTGLAASAMFAVQADWASLSRSGMETDLFVFLLMATCYSLAGQRLTPAASFAMLLALTRPEGLIMVPVVLALAIRQRHDPRELVRAAAIYVIPLTAWVVFSTSYFGSPVPQSILAKAQQSASLHQFSDSNFIRFLYFGQSPSNTTLYPGEYSTKGTWIQINVLLTLLAVAGGIYLLHTWRRERSRWALAVVVYFPVVYGASFVAAGAFTYYEWYFGPLYPMEAASAAIGLYGISRLIASAVIMRRIMISVVAGYMACQLTASLLVKLPAERKDNWASFLMASTSHLPVGSTIAAREIGGVGWVNPHSSISDLFGLVTPAALRLGDLRYLQRYRPAFISLRSDEGYRFLTTVGETPWFIRNYQLVRNLADPNSFRHYYLYARRSGGMSLGTGGTDRNPMAVPIAIRVGVLIGEAAPR
jgi:hypothetical protein